jgi:uncharacterized protein YjiS (DUF1127 family)
MSTVQETYATATTRSSAATLVIIHRAIAWFRLRSCHNSLQALPDHVLRDIGISRGEIDHVIRHGMLRQDRVANW